MAAQVLTFPARPDDSEVLGVLGLGAAVLTELLVDERGEEDRFLVENVVARAVGWVATEDVSVDDGLLIVEHLVRSLLEPPAATPRREPHLRLVTP